MRRLAVGEVEEVSWAPDGRHFVVQTLPLRSDMILVGIDGTRRALGLRAYDALWSPLGHAVALRTEDGVTALVGTDGARVDLGETYREAWSPTGSALAFLAGDDVTRALRRRRRRNGASARENGRSG